MAQKAELRFDGRVIPLDVLEGSEGERAIDIGKGWRIADSDLADFLLAHQTAPKMPRAVPNGSVPKGDATCRN